MSSFLAFRTAAFSLVRPCVGTPRRIPCLDMNYQQIRTVKKQKLRGLTDEAIPYDSVQLVDPVTGHLVRTTMKNLLNQDPTQKETIAINRRKKYVELIAVVEETGPIVKIIDRGEAFAKKKAQQKKHASKRVAHKEVQLTWSSAEADIAHKLTRAKEDLGKGSRVDVVFAVKHKHSPPTRVVMEKRVKATVEFMADVAREWKPSEWSPEIVAIFFEGTGTKPPGIDEPRTDSE